MSTPNIKPRNNQVLVLPDDKESSESKYGIVSPGNEEKEQKAMGIVIEVGPEQTDVKIGDHVIYGAMLGEILVFKNDDLSETEYRLLFDEDILAFIKD